MITLPYEVQGIIISLIPDFQKLSLVCKAFVAPCQQRIFRRVEVPAGECLVALQTIVNFSPHLAPYIKILELTYDRVLGDNPHLPSFLRKLTLQELILRRICEHENWCMMPPQFRAGIEETLEKPSLRSLVIMNVKFTSLLEFAKLLGKTNGRLRSLTLGPSVLFPRSTKEAKIGNPIQVERLFLLSTSPLTLIRPDPWPVIDPAALRFLKVVPTLANQGQVSKILESVAQSLPELHIRPFVPRWAEFPSLSFHTNTALTHISFDFEGWIGPMMFQLNADVTSPLSWTIDTLSTFPIATDPGSDDQLTNSIMEIRLRGPWHAFCLEEPGFEHLDSELGFEPLSNVLVDKFPNLQRVKMTLLERDDDKGRYHYLADLLEQTLRRSFRQRADCERNGGGDLTGGYWAEVVVEAVAIPC